MKTNSFKVLVLCFCAASAFSQAHAEPATVDLTKYSGRWYEIAHQKNDYESDCRYSTAHYTATSPTELQMENICYLADGSDRILNGTGTVTNPGEPGKLEVMLPFDIRDDYWILSLDPHYRWSVVGARTSEVLTIFSRTRKLSHETLKSILQDLREQGYDTTQLVYDRY